MPEKYGQILGEPWNSLQIIEIWGSFKWGNCKKPKNSAKIYGGNMTWKKIHPQGKWRDEGHITWSHTASWTILTASSMNFGEC